MIGSIKSPRERLRSEILRSVSRSFYLTIRFLPRRIRDPISLGYLFARATDTIADTASIDPEKRLESLRTLAGIVEGNLPASALEIVQESASQQADAAEQNLLDNLPHCLDWLNQINANDREDIRWVLAKITRGQELDLHRFADPSSPRALANADELNEYTYLVAGCVGEFWTRVCCRSLPGFSPRSQQEMIELGVRYGQGLQLINILRDAGTDLCAGRCYLPADEIAACGTGPERLLAEPKRAERVIRRWTDRAAEHLFSGLEYVCAINDRRVRFATCLPALIGARTLSLLRARGAAALEERIKVSRPEVKRLVAKMALKLATPASIRKEFARLLTQADLL